MRKRQHKKNQKKFEIWFNEYCKQLAPIIEESNRRLQERCQWRGHDYRDNRYVGIPDFDGYICICCGEKIPRRNVKRMAEEGQKAAQTGKEWQKQISFNICVRDVFRSKRVQQVLSELGEKFDPNRTYPHARKA